MTPLLALALVAYALLQSAAQVGFKLAANYAGALPELTPVWERYLFNPYFWASISTYMGLTIAWLWLLTRLPLTVAYPFLFLSFIFTPLMAYAVLHETIHWTFYLGAALIVLGVVITLQGAPHA